MRGFPDLRKVPNLKEGDPQDRNASLLAISFFTHGIRHGVDMESKDRNEIRRVFEEVYAENVRCKNLQGYSDMYTEGALWMAPSVPDRCGRAEIVEGFAEQIANQDIDPVFTADEIKVMGDVGYVMGISSATIYPHDGRPPKQVKFRALWLMKKEQENWKIDRQIWNNKPL